MNGHDWLFSSDHPVIARDVLRTLQRELFAAAVELSTKEARTKLLFVGSRQADAFGASARTVKAIGARLEELMGVVE